jgi:LuxR family maltose regulon positive regulatory protein
VARPLIGTKLYVPRPRHGLVARPRLLDVLRAGEQARLTLVSAPAGFGKTTLLADWAQRTATTGRAVAWVSLDPSDNEPASFWSYVAAALQRTVPGLDPDALERIESGSVSPEGMLTPLLNGLGAAPDEVWLVLDDYHVVVDPDVRRGVTFFLEHLPANVHVLVSTRADPDLPLPRWRVRGELVEVRASDLRFRLDETTAYLNAVAGLGLAPSDVASLEHRTEGWIATLQLAAVSIRGRTDPSGFVARFAGTDRYVVDYLVEEVLAHQPEHVREFLLQTAVVDRLTGPLCDVLTGRTDGERVLEDLERANLFLVPLDDDRRWWRYHHLFADVLKAHLLADRAELVPLLHRRASHWYEEQGLVDEAVRHALDARDFDRAAYLMELAVPAIRRHRREALLLGWLRELPDATVRRSPVLSVFYGYLLMVSGDLGAVEERFDDAERALAAGPDPSTPWADTDDLRTLPATISVHRAAIAQAHGDVAGTVAHATRALELAGPQDHLARGGAAGFLGLAAWAKGDVLAAFATFTDAVASLHAAGNLVDELTSTVVLADLLVAAGRPGAARRRYEQALAVAEAHGAPVARAAALLHVGLGELDCDAGDVDAATRHLDAATALAERAPMTESLHRWFVARGRVAAARGDLLGAVGLLTEAEEAYRPGFFPDVRPIASIRARVLIAAGDLSQAERWAEARGVSTEDGPDYLREHDHLTLVRLLVARHRAHPDPGSLDAALGLLQRLSDEARGHARNGSLLEIGLLTAVVADAAGDRDAAVGHLAQVLADAAEPEGYARLFLDEGPPMTELLGVVEQLGAVRPLEAAWWGTAASQARLILGRGGVHAGGRVGGGGIGGGQVRPAAELLSERELQVLRLLDTELTGPQIARELFVSHNTLRTHTKHIFTKLDVNTRRAAVRRAREQGLL